MKTKEREAVFVVGEGTVTALAGGPLSLADMGPRRTRRVSTIKFVLSKNYWRVRDANTGDELANFIDYDEAVQWEKDWFNFLLENPSAGVTV
jgi:hypothetical protein